MSTSRNFRAAPFAPMVSLVITILFGTGAVCLQPDWQQKVRTEVASHHLDDALRIVESRLAEDSGDLEARGWRARVLAWKGRWAEAEAEYRAVLLVAPNDADILASLSDVLVWQGKTKEALAVLDRARALAPADCEVLMRRARLLRALGDRAGARVQLREVQLIAPTNREARKAIEELRPDPRHEVRLGTEIDTFSFTDPGQAQTIELLSRWAPRWSSDISVGSYQRFAETVSKFSASGTFRFTAGDWLTVGVAAAPTNGIIPNRELLFEYGHGFRFENAVVKGLETGYQQHWFWYRGAHVLTLGVSQTYYLPEQLIWRISANGARSGFVGSGVEWVPSGSSRLGFPIYRRLSADVAFFLGAENYQQVDQIGRIATRTYAGGLKYRFTARHDISGYVAHQDRSGGRTQDSYGLSYGFRF